MKTLRKSLRVNLLVLICLFFYETASLSSLAKNPKSTKEETPIRETLNIIPNRSSIRWYGTSGMPVIAQQTGSIKVKKGKVQIDSNGDLSTAEIIIDMSSISNDNLSGELQAKIENHLKSTDFFDVKKYPEANFKSSKVEKIDDRRYQLIGELTIKNLKKNTNIVGFYTTDGFNYSFKGNFIFDRTDFGIKYGSGKFFKDLGDKLINDTVKLSFDLKANPS